MKRVYLIRMIGFDEVLGFSMSEFVAGENEAREFLTPDQAQKWLNENPDQMEEGVYYEIVPSYKKEKDEETV